MTERIVVQRGTRVVVVGSSVVGPQGPAGGGGGVTDGNKGDITVSGAGTVWSFTADMATQAELDAVAAAKANTVHSHAEADVTGLTASLAGKAPTVHTHAQADVTNLVTDLAGKVGTGRTISTTAPLTGGGDLSANRTLGVSAASDTAAGVVELATTAETTTGTDTTRAVTPAGVKAVSDLLIPKGLVDAKGDLIVATANDTPARLAVGATNGHVLTVDSAEATGLKWAAAAGGGGGVAHPHMPRISTDLHPNGMFLHPPLSVRNGTDASQTGANAQRPVWWPYILDRTAVLERVSTYCWTGEAGSTLRVGIYECDDRWKPTDLIADLGTLAGDTTGATTLSGLSQSIPSGQFALCVWQSNHTTVRWSRPNAASNDVFGCPGPGGSPTSVGWRLQSETADYSAGLPASISASVYMFPLSSNFAVAYLGFSS